MIHENGKEQTSDEIINKLAGITTEVNNKYSTLDI
jgi:hypothetical protein